MNPSIQTSLTHTHNSGVMSKKISRTLQIPMLWTLVGGFQIFSIEQIIGFVSRVRSRLFGLCPTPGPRAWLGCAGCFSVHRFGDLKLDLCCGTKYSKNIELTAKAWIEPVLALSRVNAELELLT